MTRMTVAYYEPANRLGLDRGMKDVVKHNITQEEYEGLKLCERMGAISNLRILS